MCVAIQGACSSGKRRGKTPRQIRYVSYYVRAFKITKIQQEGTFKHYNYPEEVLKYIHALVPNGAKGEILEDWFKVSLKDFFKPLQDNLL